MATQIPPVPEHRWTFETALAVWRAFNQEVARSKPMSSEQREIAENDAFVVADSAELFILDQRPQTPAQAAAVLEVVMEQPDLRVDGRDRVALRHVRDFLRPTKPQALGFR